MDFQNVIVLPNQDGPLSDGVPLAAIMSAIEEVRGLIVQVIVN